MDYNFAFEHLKARVREIPPVDPGHAFDHTWRVVQIAEKILQEESVVVLSSPPSELDLWAVKFSALLHDCVPLPKNSPLRSQSARLCAETAQAWMGECGIENPALLKTVFDAIDEHSFSGRKIPQTLVGKCLQDADRLEALGAIGLYRCLVTGASMGAQLFHPEDPWANARALDDKKYSVDHFFTKLLKLPETFQTQSGKQEAQRRADFLKSFVAQLKQELKST